MALGQYPTIRLKLAPLPVLRLKLSGVAGPQGIPGIAGATGATGATGPAGAPGAGAVDSVFGRTGVVVAVAGDYTAAKITNTPAGNIAATDVQAALNELDSEKVITPATNTADNVPQWNGANSKTLKDGRAIGTGPNNIVALNGSSQLPAVDGSLLTGIAGGSSVTPGLLYGLTLSNNAVDAVNDIDIAAGGAVNSLNATLMVRAAITKRLDAAWAAGTGNGGLDTGAIANTTYHVFLISTAAGVTTDVLFSASATAPTLPATYTLFRRIGSILRVGGTILAFNQNGNEFLLTTIAADLASVAPASTLAILRTLTVPAGIKTNALIRFRQDNNGSGGGSTLITSPDEADQAISVQGSSANTSATATSSINTFEVRTDTSSRIRTRSNDTVFLLSIGTYGWVDARGTAVMDGSGASTALTPGLLYALGIANNVTDAVNDIDISTGKATDNAGNTLLVLASGLTKRLDAAWTAGTNQGGRDTGAIADGTWHVHLIATATGGSPDVLFSLSPSAPTMPTNYTLFRRIGSIVRVGGTIKAFTQNGNEFLWSVPVADIAAGAAGNTAGTLITLSVPTGIKVNAKVVLRVDYTAAGNFLLVTSPDQANTAASGSVNSTTVTATSTPITVVGDWRTNTSAQIRQRTDNVGVLYGITTFGYIDTRDTSGVSSAVPSDLTKADWNGLGYAVGMANGSFAISAAAGALTIALKTRLLADPSVSDPVYFFFRNNTGTTGDYTVRQVTTATSLVAPSGSTFGVSSSAAFRIWIVGFDDAGTFRLGAGVFSNSTRIFPLCDGRFASSTAIGAGSTSAGVLYTGSAVTTKAMRVLGYAEWNSSGITAGTWATANMSLVQLFGPGVPLPGTVLQLNSDVTTPNDTITSVTYIMTSTSLAITPTSAANKLKIRAFSYLSSGAGTNSSVKISRGTTNNTNMIGAVGWCGAAAQPGTMAAEAFDHPNTAASQTYGAQVRAATASAFWGGGVDAWMEIQELMG